MFIQFIWFIWIIPNVYSGFLVYTIYSDHSQCLFGYSIKRWHHTGSKWILTIIFYHTSFTANFIFHTDISFCSYHYKIHHSDDNRDFKFKGKINHQLNPTPVEMGGVFCPPTKKLQLLLRIMILKSPHFLTFPKYLWQTLQYPNGCSKWLNKGF